ncbi:unnamed protein product [Vitrella brassicaformis CCMP3155]|uniref:AMP-dependent synthetase/ligase domain-containing protein n=2 Tax=Vitrella brassicaformis TaxID=1169539 RepID=A0A0G4EHH4_VITBC|nr:unnamed protein product [Vitrella brassicaformis CCMP3155]|eukprot:CEL95348.1 unnamed protein product [Vitrella brassicaformis CCMP3155]
MFGLCGPSPRLPTVTVKKDCPNSGDTYIGPDDDLACDYSVRKSPFVTARDACVEIPMAKEGVGAIKPTTLPKLLKAAAETKGSRTALQWEDPTDPSKPMIKMTYKEGYDEVCQAARALVHYGMPVFGSVAILGFNCKAWWVAYHSGMMAGGSSVGIYTTNNASACEYVCRHSEATVVFVENEKQLCKYEGVTSSALPDLRVFVVWGEDVSAYLASKGASLPAPVVTWDEFMAKGQDDALKGEVETRMANTKPGHCASLIYTSGTTGTPKGCMISHDNCIWSSRAVINRVKQPSATVPEEVVSYLPLSHIAAQMGDLIYPVIQTGCLAGHCIITFARPDALKGTLGDTLKKVKPTMFFGIPRVYEKMMERIKSVAASTKNSAIKQALIDWAKQVGKDRLEMQMVGGRGGNPIGWGLAKGLVLKKVHAALGFDRCWDTCLVGAAPTPEAVFHFFGALGIIIKDVFGMSETAAGGMAAVYRHMKIGACGMPIPGEEVMLKHQPGRDAPGCGELCIRGRNVMMGYLKDEAKSAETIDAEGWLHSGDVATTDENGIIKITGRIKEIIITAGGENLAPVPIEEFIKTHCPAISNCMVLGDKLKYLSLIITLHTKTDPQGDMMSNELVGNALGYGGSAATTVDEARTDVSYNTAIQEVINKYNDEAAVSHAQRLQKFLLVDNDFTIKGGELTGTLKVRRAAIVAKYDAEIQRLYEE